MYYFHYYKLHPSLILVLKFNHLNCSLNSLACKESLSCFIWKFVRCAASKKTNGQLRIIDMPHAVKESSWSGWNAYWSRLDKLLE